MTACTAAGVAVHFQHFYYFRAFVLTLFVISGPNTHLLSPPFGFLPVNLIFFLQISPNMSFPLSHHSLYPTVAGPIRTVHIASQIEICTLELFLFSLWVFRVRTQDFVCAIACAQVYWKHWILCPSVRWKIVPWTFLLTLFFLPRFSPEIPYGLSLFSAFY